MEKRIDYDKQIKCEEQIKYYNECCNDGKDDSTYMISTCYDEILHKGLTLKEALLCKETLVANDKYTGLYDHNDYYIIAKESDPQKEIKALYIRAEHNCHLCKKEFLGRCYGGIHHGMSVSMEGDREKNKNKEEWYDGDMPICEEYEYGGTDEHLKDIEEAEKLGVTVLVKISLVDKNN